MNELSFSRKSTRSVQDILAEAQKVLKTKPTAPEISYLTPCRNRVYYEFLGNLTGKLVVHLYDKYIPDAQQCADLQERFDTILHSHPENSGCFAPTFCHVLGYSPTGSEHPSFIKAFNITWKKEEKAVEKEVRDSPTGVSQPNSLSNVTF